MKLARPHIPGQLEGGTLKLLQEGELEAVKIYDIDATKCNVSALGADGVVIEKSSFLQAQLLRINAKDLQVKQSDFLGAVLHDVNFQGCTLERTVFERAQCKQVDLRSSQLVDISGWGSMKGVIIDDSQLVTTAPYLANELGLLVNKIDIIDVIL